MSHPNETMLRNAYGAMAVGDLQPMLKILGEETCWHVDGGSPLAGDYQGKAGCLEFFCAMGELYAGSLAVEIADVVADDRLAIVLTNESATVDGQELAWTSAHVYRFKDGKVADFTAYTDSAYHAFWAASRTPA